MTLVHQPEPATRTSAFLRGLGEQQHFINFGVPG
jgi:hypothetical protein